MKYIIIVNGYTPHSKTDYSVSMPFTQNLEFESERIAKTVFENLKKLSGVEGLILTKVITQFQTKPKR